MSQVGQDGYHAEEGAFHQFTRGIDPIAEQLQQLAGGDLSGHAELGDNAFSKVGNEVGLASAIRDATQRQINEINGLAGSMGGMREAVRNTWDNYQALEDQNTTDVRSIGGER